MALIFKRILPLLISFIIISITVLSMLPTTSGAGQKLCLATNLVKNKAYQFTHHLPEMEYKGNGNEGYTGLLAGAERIPVLMYHYVVPKENVLEPNNKSIIDLETFERGINLLYTEGYYTATLSELEDYVHGKIRLPEKTVVITFDDGYENNYIYAYPILKNVGYNAAVFLIGDRVQERTTAKFVPNKSTYFSQEQIEASGDVFEFHSHTNNLHYKKMEQCGKEYAATRDIELLKKDIAVMKHSGIDTPYLAYPYGDYNHRIMFQLTQYGYRMAFTVAKGFVRPGDNPMTLNRLTVTADTDLSVLFDD